jgi:hypothetical protein
MAARPQVGWRPLERTLATIIIRTFIELTGRQHCLRMQAGSE